MSASFSFVPTPSGTEFRLSISDRVVPLDRWPIEAPRILLSGVERLSQMTTLDQAIADDTTVLVSNEAIAALSAREATILGLPPMADAMARVATRGIVNSANFRATLDWCRPTGQPLVGAQRIGAWLRVGGQDRRLSPALFAIAEAVDAVALGTDPATRLLALGRLRDALPSALGSGTATASGLPTQIDIVQADAFSLDLVGSGVEARLVPILHRAGSNEQLLDPTKQDAFGHHQFNAFADARPIYTLPGNTFVVLMPALRRALTEVRRHQTSSIATKRGLLAAPRSFLQAALESDDDPTLLNQIETVFVETPSYSDRVIGLGLWKPRDVPWLSCAPTAWFGQDHADTEKDVVQPIALDLDAAQAESLRERVAAAIERGEPVVMFHRPNEAPIQVPATREMLETLTKRTSAGATRPGTVETKDKSQREVLLILTNETGVDHEQDFAPRPALPPVEPECLITQLKQHQAVGLRWLQDSWLAGAPGVLLADDMGLGKTLQGLAFLAWLREAMQRGVIPRAPVLIVAPTGLLANWAAEHARHLSGVGLGDCLTAFGAGLRVVRRPDSPALDHTIIQSADWVMTTYETLRDYSADFGAVHFAALLADEAQKVKTPGVRMTDALKGMHADFRIAMTGTPVENRLADLWCIVDGVRAGWLGDLAGFSRTYEGPAALDDLRQLKERLDQPFGGAPPLLLRRMKEDHLPDLPQAEVHVRQAAMPVGQRGVYEEVLATAKSASSRGSVLEALQRFRSLSLHPDPDMEADDQTFIAASARFALCFEVLDQIVAAKERALVFLDNLRLQPRIAGLIQRRYKLDTTPEIISGEVAGTRRQARVDRFQTGPEGFDAMILSPRAAGVGLTITRANHVIHLSRWWNPAVEDQCTGRVLRIGQTRTVHIHVPIAILHNGPRSFDENLHALMERKRKLMREALLPAGLDSEDQEALLSATINTT